MIIETFLRDRAEAAAAPKLVERLKGGRILIAPAKVLARLRSEELTKLRDARIAALLGIEIAEGKEQGEVLDAALGEGLLSRDEYAALKELLSSRLKLSKTIELLLDEEGAMLRTATERDKQ